MATRQELERASALGLVATAGSRWFALALSRPPRKVTLPMYHMERQVVEFDAVTPGPRWLVQCHNRYHHMGGAATEIVYR